MTTRLVVRVMLIAGAVPGAFFGGKWAVRPFYYPPQGLYPMGWTQADLICDRYPVHLVSTKWADRVLSWILAETAARLGVVAVGVILFMIGLKLTRGWKPDDGKSGQQTEPVAS